MYNGGYDDMVLAKTAVRSRVESENAQREKKIAQLQEFIARFSAGTRSAQATSRKKEVERLQTAELAKSNIARPFIRFQVDQASGRHPLEIKSVAKTYDGLKVWRPFSAAVERGERIALMGRNGTGKTTLLRSLIRNAPGFIDDDEKKFPVDGGQVVWGHNAAVGYFPQDRSATINRKTTTMQWLADFDPRATQEQLRGLLGQMLFSGDDATKPTSALSGGESVRLILCRLMLAKPNILVLDEPTNDLDLESINALNVALQKYDGTLIMVTHDHDVIDEVATRIWHAKDGRIEDFKGPYSDYLAYAKEKAS
jgi:ATPase subunit of ABC transporter with duplicated ATPase domains